MFRRARTWSWETPFVLNRHVKQRKGKDGQPRLVDGPEDQVRLELKRRGLPHLPDDVQVMPAGSRKPKEWRSIRPIEFYRWRKQGPRSGMAYGFRLEFQEPIQGPLALGYGCHFGLGLFMPVGQER